MPDYLQQFESEQAQSSNEQLGQAMHDAKWSNTFANTPSTEVLRNNRNVTDLVNGALDRKMQLAAQTDKNAQEIYQKGEQFKEWQSNAPLRDELLRGKIASQGAATKYRAQQDALTLKDTSDFYNGVNAIQAPIGSREHATAYMENLAAHPMAASTVGVRGDIERHTQVHDLAAQLTKGKAAFRQAMGYDPESAEITATGGVNLRGKSATGPPPEGIIGQYAKAKAQFHGHIVAAMAEAKKDPKAAYTEAGPMEAARQEMIALERAYPQLSGTGSKRKALDEIFK